MNTFLRDDNRVPDTHTTRGNSVSYEEASFESGDSPTVLQIADDLGRNGRGGYIANDGDGDFTIEVANHKDGDYGGVHTVKKDEVLELNGMNIARIRITHVADSSYRAMVV